jgi:hypothetical protein
MKLKILTLGAGLALAAGAVAFAADAPGDGQREDRVVIVCAGGPHGPDGPAHAEHARAMHDGLDANHDGSVTRDEFRGMHDQMFDHLDKNHDGKLSGDELPHGPGVPGGPEMHGCGSGDMGDAGGDDVRIIRHGPGGRDGQLDIDANKDGRISFDEFVAPMREHFTEADKNHDGFLDKDEMGGDHQFVFRHVERRDGEGHH